MENKTKYSNRVLALFGYHWPLMRELGASGLTADRLVRVFGRAVTGGHYGGNQVKKKE
jgi:hypothetical protein